jgi:site-specific DNA recombinase
LRGHHAAPGDDRASRIGDLATDHTYLEQSAELIAALRRMVESVAIYAAPNQAGFSIEVRGRLAQLTNSAAFPPCSGVGVISGSERGTRTPDPRIMIPVL